jgi:hypothetical protein
LAFALTALTANVAAAQQGTPAQRAACTPDAYRLCGIYIPNAAAITQCLRANRKRLSRDCRAVFEGRLK